ncbi:MAG: molybdenum cofactor biosynthesis protein MoaE [Actinomycetota bacterium]|nr:molybdenum cofactor biosynthesis protein MoaE [Actinomycetota bacterium]
MGNDPPYGCDDWVGVSADPLPLHAVTAFVERPDCGAAVVFTGSVRDHSEGRANVRSLEYEAYEEQVTPRLTAIAGEARARWPDVGRLVLLHRTGLLGVGEASVMVAASSPHRAEAFEAARFCIDTLKATAPIWKREAWEGGEDWAACAHPVDEIPTVGR